MRHIINQSILEQLEKHISAHRPMVRSVLASRDGQMVYERYFEDAAANSRPNIWSCTKSVVSVLVGILVKQNNFPGLDEKIANLLPSLAQQAHESFKKITVAHCLNMTIGCKFWN